MLFYANFCDMKVLLSIVFLFASLATFSQAVINFSNRAHDFGTIKEVNGAVSYDFDSFNSININFENYAKNKLGFEDEDFESLGFLGLSDAIDRYNPNNESDIKFETYASMRIQGAIFDAFRTIDGLPKSVRREIKKLNKTIEITIGIKMQNNLTKKEIDNLCKWAKKYNIEDLDTEEKILDIILDIKELKIVSDEIDYLPNEIFKLTNLRVFI